MRRLVSASWLRIRRRLLGRALLVLMLVVLAVQLEGRVDRLELLEAKLEEAETTVAEETLGQLAIASYRVEADSLRDNLSFPNVIGYGARLATDFGWFLLIALTAIVAGEDSKQGTLRAILSRGVGRARYVAACFLSLWLAAGVAVIAVTLLSAILGPGLHARANGAPVCLDGLGLALLSVVRVWFASAPFIAATLFWAILARSPGPALGVSVTLQFIGFVMGSMLPFVAVTGSLVARLPGAIVALIRLYSLTIGYSADIFMHWGIPIVKPTGAMGAIVMADSSMLSISPWRAIAFILGYTVLFVAWTSRILRRRDVTSET
jgi:ABC-type transport system involved in multi-copper enzyme maturation permease subunit